MGRKSLRGIRYGETYAKWVSQLAWRLGAEIFILAQHPFQYDIRRGVDRTRGGGPTVEQVEIIPEFSIAPSRLKRWSFNAQALKLNRSWQSIAEQN